MLHCACLKRDRVLLGLHSIETRDPGSPHSHPVISGVEVSVGCYCQVLHEAPASCSVQEFQKHLQIRFPALTITANRLCPLSLAPGSEQPCVKLVRLLVITGEESTPVR